MNNLEIINYAQEGLKYRKLRSWLTILGVVIGISSIVILIALAQGLDKAVKAEISGFGTNFIQIFPGKGFMSGGSGGPNFNGAIFEKDTDSLRRLPGIEGISSLVSPGYASFAYKNSSFSTILTGIEPEAFNAYVKTTGMDDGQFLVGTDHTSVVIGNKIAKGTFKDDVEVGKTLYINGVPFRVKGIINPSAAFDNDIYVDKHAARQFISDTEDPDRIFGIFIILKEGVEVKPVADRAEKILINNHKVKPDEKDFTIMTADSILDAIGSIFTMLSIFLGMIAGISLLVGSIGIANSMYTSVMERTREIGILKAIGASSSTIVRIFIVEAGIIGFIGGFVGVCFGWVVSAIFNQLGAPSEVSIELMVFGIAISVIVGLLSGYFPAKQASQMLPVDALKYE